MNVADKEPKVSVIIPVYNGEMYLKRCIDSICRQTLEAVEIILVDDGSTDGSARICDEYAKEKSFIKVIHKANQGLTAAWKTGVAMASAPYVGFVDADDYVDEDMFEVLYERGMEHKADLVCCGLIHEYEEKDHAIWKEQMKVSDYFYTKSEYEKILFPQLINDGSFMGRVLQPNRVTKLVKRELILSAMHLCHNEVSVGEDFQFSLVMLLSSQSVYVVKDFYPYHYWMNQNSMTGIFDYSYMNKITFLKEEMEKITQTLSDFDFKKQIMNDFLCLTVLNVKGEIYKNKKLPWQEHKKNLGTILKNPLVKEALRSHSLFRISLAEELFLFFMKKEWYGVLFLVVRIYFR